MKETTFGGNGDTYDRSNTVTPTRYTVRHHSNGDIEIVSYVEDCEGRGRTNTVHVPADLSNELRELVSTLYSE